ncbi:MAG: rod shape-determining protein MreC [Acidobacteria bacterium]|nr:rod shape-determining protein MreC [Acidobacteriota bacterium]
MRRFDRSTSLFMILVFLSFVLATVDVRSAESGAGDSLRSFAQAAFTPLQRATDAVTRPIVGFVDGIANLASLNDENERLRADLREAERRIQDTAALEARIQELEATLNLEVPGDFATVAAEMFAQGPTGFDHVRLLNKGSADGVVVGQAVVDENGLIGRIDLVNEKTSRVRLITDPSVAVGVKVVTTSESGWTTGQGTGSLTLTMYRATRPVNEGDGLVTHGGRFPPNLPVGTVRDTATLAAGFQLVTEINPAVDFGRLGLVRIIVGFSPLDAPEEPFGPQAPPITVPTDEPTDLVQ